MTLIKTSYNRRSFLKVSSLATGGIMIGFNWACSPGGEKLAQVPENWFDINAYLSIASNGQVTIMSPNPEVGQNVKTSMPMIIAEELDVDWKNVIVKQAPLNTEAFTRQVAGGSQSIRLGWKSLRMAGATGRRMLIQAAAENWQLSADELTTKDGHVVAPNGKKLSYGELAEKAASVEIPEEVELKDIRDFSIIGKSKKNVDLNAIISGKPLFGIDTRREGMLFAVVMRPPAFGLKLDSFDDNETRQVAGVVDVVSFGNKIAVLAVDTWAAIKGQRKLNANWVTDQSLEDSTYHSEQLTALVNKKSAEPRRKDGNTEKAFKSADKVIAQEYEAPFLPHNPLEPMNFFAHVTDEKVDMMGPIQTPEGTRRQLAQLLGRDEKDIFIGLTRMGGGFGRRLYGDFALEAAEISKLTGKPIQLIYTREDDMTAGIYRPASKYKFRAAIKDNQLTAWHLTGAAVNTGNATREHNWPASCLENYLVETHNLQSNITTGAWRAPITNFLAFAEQTFADEVAEALGKDPIEFRLELLRRAAENPVGELQYDPNKMIAAIELARDKGNWNSAGDGVYQGFSVYYSHNSYVAEVADIVMERDKPKIKKITVGIHCGIVINPDAAINQCQGGVLDGIGHAMFGLLQFENGKPSANNFHQYRLMRIKEAPEVDIHFVQSNDDPTGLGEPPLPPAAAAVANAIYKATGKRIYNQPFVAAPIQFA